MAKKYIDAEKLIKSVNNYREGARAALNPIDGDADYYIGKIDACEDMKEFITSLQQEQPEVDFETEYAKFSNDPDADYAFPIDLADYKDFAHHFYELGKNSK